MLKKIKLENNGERNKMEYNGETMSGVYLPREMLIEIFKYLKMIHHGYEVKNEHYIVNKYFYTAAMMACGFYENLSVSSKNIFQINKLVLQTVKTIRLFGVTPKEYAYLHENTVATCETLHINCDGEYLNLLCWNCKTVIVNVDVDNLQKQMFPKVVNLQLNWPIQVVSEESILNNSFDLLYVRYKQKFAATTTAKTLICLSDMYISKRFKESVVDLKIEHSAGIQSLYEFTNLTSLKINYIGDEYFDYTKYIKSLADIAHVFQNLVTLELNCFVNRLIPSGLQFHEYRVNKWRILNTKLIQNQNFKKFVFSIKTHGSNPLTKDSIYTTDNAFRMDIEPMKNGFTLLDDNADEYVYIKDGDL